MKRIIYLLMVIGSISLADAQIVEMTGSLKTYLLDKLETMPGEGTNVFQNQSTDNFTQFKSAINLLANDDFTTAASTFELLGYRLVRFTDESNSSDYYIVEEWGQNPSYQGTYVYCPSCPRSKVVLQAPHSLKDADTGSESIKIYYDLQSKWLMFNSSHRCNSTTASSCDGTTAVCSGGSQPYPISDMAHNDETFLQAFTIALNEHYTDNEMPLFIVQLHGFGKDSRPADFPHVVASHGTRKLPPEERTESQQIHDTIETLCDCEVGQYHLDTEIDELGGTSNTQGRYLNASEAPCNTSASINSGKFYHIEQSAYIRENLDFIFQALESISEPIGTPPPVLAVDETTPFEIYPNPVSDQLEIRYQPTSFAQVDLRDTSGKILLTEKFNGSESMRLKIGHFKPGIYYLTIKSDANATIVRKIIKR